MNLLMKLAGSTWRASANTMVICSGALLFSSRDCTPVWSRSAHTSKVDVQLNSTMRLISATLHSTPLPWLPVLSNIEPPALRRKTATDKLVEKIVKHDSWPIQPDILKGKGKGLDTCYSATYMSGLVTSSAFTISKVAADWHEPIVPQRTM